MTAAHGTGLHGRGGPGSGPPVVFVSYCRQDAEWLRRFEVMLKPEVHERGIEVWSDTSIAASRTWRPEIDAAIARADVALLLVSPDFLASDFIMGEELPTLIQHGVPLVPVLLRTCRHETVRALASVQWAHDPRREGPVAQADDVDAAIVRVTDALMATLDDQSDRADSRDDARGVDDEQSAGGVARSALTPAASAGAIDGVPEAPLGFVARDELDELRGALLGAGEGALAITGGEGLGLHGQGGIGKTVLAAALARDPIVRSHFPDGVFWVTVGESSDLVGAQIDLLERLGVAAGGVRTTLDGVRALRDALANRRCLLVVDDVWSAAATQAFDVTGPEGRVLYTTRDPRLLCDVRAQVRRIEVLSAPGARQLLASLTGTSVGELPDDVDRVLTATGRVALALALVGAAVGRGGRGWREVADELEAAAGTFLEHPYANVFKAMGVAVATLDREVAAAHETLTRTVPLHTQAHDALRRWYSARPPAASDALFVSLRRRRSAVPEPISVGAVGDIVARHGAAAGVREDGRTAHALRHTFCTMLAERGVALEVIRALAGHVDVRTTQIYVDVTDQRKADGIAALEGAQTGPLAA